MEKESRDNGIGEGSIFSRLLERRDFLNFLTLRVIKSTLLEDAGFAIFKIYLQLETSENGD